MLVLKTNKTGSLGNSYNLVCNGKTLILELGLDYKDTLLTIDNINNVVGCVVSHFH